MGAFYGENMYVCSYCGEPKSSLGDMYKSDAPLKCEKCGCTDFKFFINKNYYDNHADDIEKTIKFKFGKLVDTWEEHKRQGITPTSGETPMPKCPTCGSENIRRISQNERAGNALMFGLYGNKRKYQFECLNKSCGYKW